MKMKSLLFMAFAGLVFFGSCKKDEATVPVANMTLTFLNNVSEAYANPTGEYLLQGHISSPVSLDRVELTKEGASAAFKIDNTTAKNKNEYDYSYLVTGITANTYIILDAYDQNGAKKSTRFLVKKL
jgi:hypothetical protein